MSDAEKSDEDEAIPGTPPELTKAAEELRNDLLPAKSRDRYNAVYDAFTQWKKTKTVNLTTENVVLAYFGELARKYKPPTLWATYSMLRSTVHINENINLENFKQVVAFLKRQSSGYQAKKSRVFSASDMKSFLDNAPDNQYLVTKVVLIFGISGACRSAELTNLTVDDVLNRGDVMIIKLRDTKTKTTRTFTIEGEFQKKVMAYQALRPKNAPSNRFFVNYRNGRCSVQVIGKNKLGGMPKEIAEFLKLPNPELYTGHSFRRSSATLCADGGADITEIKRLGGWKSTTVAEGYIEESVGYKRKTGQQISAAIAGASTVTTPFKEAPKKQRKIEQNDKENSVAVISSITSTVIEEEDLAETSLDLKKQRLSLQLNNCTNVTINYTN